MARLTRLDLRTMGILSFAVLIALFTTLLGVTFASPEHLHAQANPQNPQGGAAMGFTDGWLNGQTVQFFYTKNFFCQQPPSSAATTKCEVGAAAQTTPVPDQNIPELYVMTPLGFTPDLATLHCPVLGSCINHPSTIDLSRILGPGTGNAPLPRHSHIIDKPHGGWWRIVVIGVRNQAIWDQIVAAKDHATVEALQAANNPGITQEIPSNSFLFFSVRQ